MDVGWDGGTFIYQKVWFGLYLTHVWLWAMQRARTLCNGKAMDYRDSAM